jgi:hypothetical protein
MKRFTRRVSLGKVIRLKMANSVLGIYFFKIEENAFIALKIGF